MPRKANTTPIKTDSDGNIILPRLSKNSGFLGPEYYGCSGTGQRPKILHCGYSNRYIVGTEYAVTETRAKIMASPRKRIFGKGREQVFAFKGRTAAVAKFNELCRAVRQFNTETRANHAADREAAKKGDFGALLRLGDY